MGPTSSTMNVATVSPEAMKKNFKPHNNKTGLNNSSTIANKVKPNSQATSTTTSADNSDGKLSLGCEHIF